MRWPRILGAVPSPKDVNLLCWILLAAIASFLFVAHSGGQRYRAADFVQIYSVGKLLNEYPAQELYNYHLQRQISDKLHRLPGGFYGPSPYPPFVAVLFRPLARVPYLQAYLLWMAITLVLYLAGLVIITAKVSGDPLRRSLTFCLALGFYPFLVGTLINGQLSAIGFFALALAIREDDRGRPVLSGLALSLCSYKPTLLVLILPMLLLRRRLKTLAGFVMGVLALASLATAIEGVRIWSGYIGLLRYFIGMHSQLRLTVYMDFQSFALLLSRAHPWFATTVVAVFSCWVGVSLCRVWLRSAAIGQSVNILVWGTTVTWTLLLNLYVPVYDSILLVLSTVLTFRDMNLYAGRWFGALCALLFVSAWATVQAAEVTGVQTLTIFVVALGALQIYVCNQQVQASAEGPLADIDKRPPEGFPPSNGREGVSAIVSPQ